MFPRVITYSYTLATADETDAYLHMMGLNRGRYSCSGGLLNFKTPQPDLVNVQWASAWIGYSAGAYGMLRRSGVLLEFATLTGDQGYEAVMPLKTCMVGGSSVAYLNGPVWLPYNLGVILYPFNTGTDLTGSELKVRVVYA